MPTLRIAVRYLLAINLAIVSFGCAANSSKQHPEQGYLTDEHFRLRFASGPRPLLYLTSSGYWPGFESGCQPLVGGGFKAPALIVFSDRRLVFVRPEHPDDNVARFYALSLTARELEAIKTRVLAARLDKKRIHYDLSGGVRHASLHEIVSWFGGVRRRVAIRGWRLGLQKSGLPAELGSLLRWARRYSHPRARLWTPRFVTTWSPSTDEYKPVSWPDDWPRPPAKKGTKDRTLSLAGRYLNRLVALMSPRASCFERRLVKMGNRHWRVAIKPFGFPQQRLWQHQQATLVETLLLLKSDIAEERASGPATSRRDSLWRAEDAGAAFAPSLAERSQSNRDGRWQDVRPT
jgi:hypothetical protein